MRQKGCRASRGPPERAPVRGPPKGPLKKGLKSPLKKGPRGILSGTLQGGWPKSRVKISARDFGKTFYFF